MATHKCSLHFFGLKFYLFFISWSVYERETKTVKNSIRKRKCLVVIILATKMIKFYVKMIHLTRKVCWWWFWILILSKKKISGFRKICAINLIFQFLIVFLLLKGTWRFIKVCRVFLWYFEVKLCWKLGCFSSKMQKLCVISHNRSWVIHFIFIF